MTAATRSRGASVTTNGRPSPSRRSGGRGHSAGGWVVRVIAGVVLLALAYLAGVAGQVWWVARHDDRPRSDAIVVLGASQYDGRPSLVLAARLDHARRLYAAKVAAHVLTVGGKAPGDRFTEGGTGRRYLQSHGVPGSALVAIGRGRDTYASLQAVRALAQRRGWHRIVIVTDPWHSLRSRAMAEHLGLDAATSPARSGPAVRTRGVEVRYVLRETLAYVYWQVFHESSDSGVNAV